MARSSLSFLKSALRVLNYSTSVVLITYYIGTVASTLRQSRHLDNKTHLRSRKKWLLLLTFATTACYAVQSLRLIPYLSLTSDDALVHVLSQTLFWASVSIITVNSTILRPTVYIGLPMINLMAEIVIFSSTFWISKHCGDPVTHVLGGLKIVTLLVLTLSTITAVLLLLNHRSRKIYYEIEPLLAENHRSSSSSSLFDRDSALLGNERDDTESLSSDDDEEGLKAVRKQRLEFHGGWIGYLLEFRVFWPYILPTNSIKLQLYVAALLVNILIQRALNVLHPRQLGIVIDKLALERHVPWKDILLYIVYETVASNSCGVGAINEMLENRLSAWSRRELTVASLDHVMGLSMKFHDQKDSGEIIKAIEQAGSLQSLLRILILEIAPSGIDIIVAMWYVTYLFNIYAALIVVAVGILFVSVTYHITAAATHARRLLSRKERNQSKSIYESVSNWFTISSFNRKRYTVSNISRIADDFAKANLWNDDLYTYIFAAQEGSEKIGRVAITIFAAYRITAGAASVGDLVALESYWDTITTPLYVLGHGYRDLNSDLVDAERLLQLFHESPIIVDSINARPLKPVSGEVVFDNIDFAYEGREPTLQAFNLHAKPGQMVALVGETGSGKSTFLKLLMRFYDVSSGSVTIDGQDIRHVTLDSLREIFGYVPQDSVLFNTTILENVRYGKLEATDEEVYAACRAASIHGKILSFRNGYRSMVGERGVKLSGGERQRIAIARVFLKNPQIVLLDEATAAMDSKTETIVQTALRRLTQGRTTFVVAHRLSTIVDADTILVVDRGSVVESGSHEALLQQRGRYFEL